MAEMKARILVADDEKDIRDILKLLLESEGYEVILASNGKEVLEKASEDINLYILDVDMPECNGFMAGAEIYRKYQASIIFLTAYSGESDKVMGFSVGCDDYITKPFSNMELLMRVKAILRRSLITKEKLERAVRLGNEFKGKTYITFMTDSGPKKIETTVWTLTDHYIQIKGSVAIPQKSLIDVSW